MAEKSSKRGPQNLLQILPDSFTAAQLLAIRLEHGLDAKGTDMMIRQWLHRNYIRCRFWESLLFFYIISFGTRGSPAKQASQNTAGQDRFHASVHCIRLYSGVSSGCVPKYAQTAS